VFVAQKGALRRFKGDQQPGGGLREEFQPAPQLHDQSVNAIRG